VEYVLLEFLTFELLISFIVFGCCAGCLAGLLGIGGGVILVPLFMWRFQLAGFDPQYIVHCAFATSLAIIIPTAVSNTIGHHKQGNVRRNHVLYLAIGAGIGACVGSFCASLLTGSVLALAFGVMQMAVALKLLTGASKPSSDTMREQGALLLFVGFIGGTFSSFFGVGGGVIAVPLMVILLRFPIHLAVGNSTALIVISSLIGSCAYIFMGWQVKSIEEGFLGFVYFPAVLLVVPFSLFGARIGVRLAQYCSHAKMVKVFSLLLICVGVKMIWSSLGG
jgi:uncharacterized membrane protein YfcA